MNAFSVFFCFPEKLVSQVEWLTLLKSFALIQENTTYCMKTRVYRVDSHNALFGRLSTDKQTVVPIYMIKAHVHRFFDTNLHEATNEAIMPSGFYVQLTGWRSVSQNPFKMGLCFCSTVINQSTQNFSSQNSLKRQQFVLDDRQYSSLFWCAVSGPPYRTLRNWLRKWSDIVSCNWLI